VSDTHMQISIKAIASSYRNRIF